MSLEPVIGVAIAVFFVGNRARWFYMYQRNRKAADAFEQQLHRLQRGWSSGSPYRVADGRDADLVGPLGIASAPYEDKLRACGFHLLGDLVAERDENSAITRVMIDAAGTTCAYIMILPTRPDQPLLFLSSYTLMDMYSTRTIRVPHAEPASTHRQVVASTMTIEQSVDMHRRFASFEASDQSFVRIADVPGLLAQLAVVHERDATWRNSQPPDQLLDADLRAALGDNYDRWGKAWARRIRSKGVPQATVRRN